MNELLKKLLEAEVLTEETKKELEEAFNTQLNAAIKSAKDDAAADVRAELTEQWIKERDTLIEALDAKVSEFLESELKELKGDIERFRDLEAEHAEKLVEAKGAMAKQLKSDIGTLIEKLDSFIEIRLAAEMEELREDIEEQKKKEFGKKVFEAFATEFKKHYAGNDTTEGQLRETEQRLEDSLEQLEKAEKELATMKRAAKLGEVLKPLSGRQKDVMEAILKNVDTDMLEEAYKTYIGRVVKEAASATPEKEDKVLAEGAKKDDKKAVEPKKVVEGVTKTGDNADVQKEQDKDAKDNKLTEAQKLALQKLAGIVS